MVHHPHNDESQPLMNDQDTSVAEAGRPPYSHAHPDAPLESLSSSNRNSNDRRDDRPEIDSTDIDMSSSRRCDDSDDAGSTGSNRNRNPVEDIEVESSGVSTPRFVQDENSWKRWRWVPYPVRRVFKSVVRWSHGPPNPQPYRIKPLLPAVQELPLRLADRLMPKRRSRRAALLFAYFSAWLIIFVLLKRQETLADDIAGWGTPRAIGCGTTYWGSGNGCGLDGANCRPFNGSGFPFRCPANCESYHVLNPRAVGDQEVIYKPFVVGGPPSDEAARDDLEAATYRGDSFVCEAAIHAGVITNGGGGCGVVRLIGEQAGFIGSDRHGIPSVGFDSYFPLSYEFVANVECSAQDMRWSIMAVTAVFAGVLSLFTSSPALFFFPSFIGIYWTTGMATDSPPNSTVAGTFSEILGKFLPAMFVAWVMYDKMGIRRTLGGLRAQIEKTILWLGPCWVGALDNYTLSFIPIQRLTGHDLEQQPGAKAALAIIVVVLVGIVASQIYFFRQEGRLLKYLRLYAVFILTIVIFLTLPGLNLRIHHYILALLLLPGTSLQTRPSLVYQGLLIGLFINGIARWGFHSVLQTPADLQGDAHKGSSLPVIPTPEINWAEGAASNITIRWEPTVEERIDGISVLVNDVERFRSYFEDAVDHEDAFVWTREPDLDLPEYFRFAFMTGSKAGDYTKAAIWTADGEWQKMADGPSKVKGRSTGEDEQIMRL